MGCVKVGHCHSWPTAGSLVIQRCEQCCNFCEGEAGKKIWKYAWFLRRHVRAVHVGKSYPHLVVESSWNEDGAIKLEQGDQGPEFERAYPDGLPPDVQVQWVAQPGFYKQQYGPTPFPEDTNFALHTFNVEDLFNPGFDPDNVAVHPNGQFPAFANEAPITVPPGGANVQPTMDDLDRFIMSMTEGLEEGMVIGNQSNLPGSFTEGDALDADDEATGSRPPECHLATEAVTSNYHVSPGAATHDEVAVRDFFMGDHEAPDQDSFDTFDDMLVAQASTLHAAQPSFDEHRQMLALLQASANQISNSGMSFQSMFNGIDMFAQTMQKRSEEDDA